MVLDMLIGEESDVDCSITYMKINTLQTPTLHRIQHTLLGQCVRVLAVSAEKERNTNVRKKTW